MQIDHFNSNINAYSDVADKSKDFKVRTPFHKFEDK